MTRNINGQLDMSIDMEQTDAWIQDLMKNGRKRTTCATHRNNVRQCRRQLLLGNYSTDASEIDSSSILYLWGTLRVKEEVRITYVRSLAQMVRFHTGRDILKAAKILRFISTEDFCRAHRQADPFQRLILCLGAYMGLRRKEMAELRDSDIVGDMMTIHGKGHGDGLIVSMKIPQPVMKAIVDYRNSAYKMGIRADDYLIQTRSHTGILHMSTPARVHQDHHPLPEEVLRHHPVLRARLRHPDGQEPDAPCRSFDHHEVLRGRLPEERERCVGQADGVHQQDDRHRQRGRRGP